MIREQKLNVNRIKCHETENSIYIAIKYIASLQISEEVTLDINIVRGFCRCALLQILICSTNRAGNATNEFLPGILASILPHELVCLQLLRGTCVSLIECGNVLIFHSTRRSCFMRVIHAERFTFMASRDLSS